MSSSESDEDIEVESGVSNGLQQVFDGISHLNDVNCDDMDVPEMTEDDQAEFKESLDMLDDLPDGFQEVADSIFGSAHMRKWILALLRAPRSFMTDIVLSMLKSKLVKGIVRGVDFLYKVALDVCKSPEDIESIFKWVFSFDITSSLLNYVKALNFSEFLNEILESEDSFVAQVKTLYTTVFQSFLVECIKNPRVQFGPAIKKMVESQVVEGIVDFLQFLLKNKEALLEIGEILKLVFVLDEFKEIIPPQASPFVTPEAISLVLSPDVLAVVETFTKNPYECIVGLLETYLSQGELNAMALGLVGDADTVAAQISGLAQSNDSFADMMQAMQAMSEDEETVTQISQIMKDPIQSLVSIIAPMITGAVTGLTFPDNDAWDELVEDPQMFGGRLWNQLMDQIEPNVKLMCEIASAHEGVKSKLHV